MRLHHLSMTAFGPFADTVEVDFDELSAAGLFLLTGATGAGKSSVLDAVCFALYGQVPGDRAGARHLRSDHAPPGRAPGVVLEVTIGDRRFRFTRSPAWSRPKQRGTGETRVQAHVVVEELRGDGWVGLTNRLDDAGLLVSDLLGMTATQFTQVAMLPQGRFQAFLRASSADRHAVLQKLFRTDRFEQVERWLVERRGEARRAAEAVEADVLDVLHRFQEVAGAALPFAAEEIARAADDDELLPWAEGVVTDARDATEAAEATRARAAQDLAVADETLVGVRRLHELRNRAEAAADELVGLAARADELTALREQLAGHRRAAPLAALVARRTACHRVLARAESDWLTAAHGLDLPEDDPGPALATLHRTCVAEQAAAESFRPRLTQLDAQRERLVAVRQQIDVLAQRTAALDEEIAGHPDVLQRAETALAEAEAAVAALPVRRLEVAGLEEQLDASRRHDQVTADLATARADLAAAHDAALAAKDHYLGVREARINGMAAELAGALTVGCACPVCGSASHPAPATAAGSVVGRAEEDAARKVSEDLAFAHQGQEVRVAALVAEQAALTGRLAGVDRPTLPDRLGAAREALSATEHLAATRDDRAAELAGIRARATAVAEARARTIAELASSREQEAGIRSTVEALTAELDALLGDEADDLDGLVRIRAERMRRVDAALTAFTAYDEARRAARDATEEVATAARDLGFADEDAAASALLGPDRADEIERTLSEAEARRVVAEQVLADPDVRAAATAELPDLDVAVVRQRAAADAVQAAHAATESTRARRRRLEVLHARLTSVLRTWEPLREQHALVARLSQLVEGKGPDNPLRMRLAAYVLAERLRQVVAAANERLTTMTGGRYALEHTDDRGAGEQRGGLSLRVCDEWSGVSRDPATLSGGETFVVSLALALGLADTVAHEAGGTDIDTLFIDEGFGSLDTETLEDVMDTLDSLRDGGRVVGLVSHVPELRSRITTQLEVAKGRSGSTVRPVLVAG